MVKLVEVVKVLRSKNAGPFMTTIDIFFKDERAYKKVKESGLINRDLIARIYNIPKEDVVGIFYYDVVWGVKVTIKKPGGLASGDPGQTDLFGCQQYIPLRDLEIDLD